MFWVTFIVDKIKYFGSEIIAESKQKYFLDRDQGTVSWLNLSSILIEIGFFGHIKGLKIS